MALYGVFIALVDGNQKVYATGLLPQTDRGTGLGTFNAVLGFAELIASLGGGSCGRPRVQSSRFS